MNEKQPVKRDTRPMIIIAVVLAIIAIWFFITRRDNPKMIEPSTSGTPEATKSIPADSLHH